MPSITDTLIVKNDDYTATYELTHNYSPKLDYPFLETPCITIANAQRRAIIIYCIEISVPISESVRNGKW